MADEYIVIRGLDERENGRWYNLTRMARCGSTRMSPEERATCLAYGSFVNLGPTGVFEYNGDGEEAQVYRPV